MPTYQYECDDCGHSFDALQSISAKRLTECPVCKKPALSRLIGTGSGLIFKGSGFYETDYKSTKTPACPSAESCPAAKTEQKQGEGCGCSGGCDH
ncbi:MAG: FmdB family zinc ribbon protein [Candidatus Omnitrophota bacterium]